jgi:hypothetical protein
MSSTAAYLLIPEQYVICTKWKTMQKNAKIQKNLKLLTEGNQHFHEQSMNQKVQHSETPVK